MNPLAQVTFETTTETSGLSGGAIAGIAVGYLAILIVLCIAYWRIFTKLGLPGWQGIVPIVNVYMLFKARGQREPLLWLLLFLIPCINIIALWFLASDTAELFGKTFGWKLVLFFLPGLGALILAFSDAAADRNALAPGVGLNAGSGPPPAF